VGIDVTNVEVVQKTVAEDREVRKNDEVKICVEVK
jgi:hypothetical protein